MEVWGENVNRYDKWDSTPLYYASYCGHLHVVKYLLDNGAYLERDSIDGARCLYSALTQAIRQELQRRGFNKADRSSELRRKDAYISALE